jgi:signal peptidase I
MPRLEKNKPSTLTYIIEGAILVLALLLGLAIREGVYETSIVISRSMEPTLLVGDRLLIDHRTSLHGGWRRGDIVLFVPPASWQDEQQESYLKRVIGLPGETIETGPAGVTINGQALREEYTISAPPDESPIRITLGAGQYFMMGDNRANSADSRKYGPVSDVDIRGRALWRLGPLGRTGKLPKPSYQAIQ